jgi:hypothetical protein
MVVLAHLHDPGPIPNKAYAMLETEGENEKTWAVEALLSWMLEKESSCTIAVCRLKWGMREVTDGVYVFRVNVE